MTAQDLFEILMREQADMLTVFLRSAVRDPGAVDDLFQETMITAWKKLDTYDRTRPFGPWLRRIAAKLILAHRRKSARQVAIGDEELLEYLNTRCAELQRQSGDTLDEKLAGLRDCIEALPGSYRDVIQLTYRDELPTQSLAERLRLPLETVKKRLQRARGRLLECLDRRLSSKGA